MLIGACSRRTEEPAAKPRPSAAEAPAPSGSTAGLELRWVDPPGWKRRPGSNAMRKFEYTIARAPGDTEDGELVVTSFGQGQGGSIDSNIDRWVRQFSPDAKSEAKRDKRTAGGYPVELVDVDGTYNAMAMPGGPPPQPKPRYRLLGAIVSTPSTLWFFKMTGPDATVAAARSQFHALLDTVH